MWWFPIALAELPVVSHPTSAERARLVFLGDTGRTPTDEGCAWRPDGTVRESCHLTTDQLQSLREAVRGELPDAIYALGDLVYWRAPACKTPRGRALRKLDASIGGPLTGLGAPVYLVLGNHDLAQRRNAPRRVRCLTAYAASRPDLELPARQYVVEHGVADVLVLDTNRRRTLPGDTLDARATTDRWLVAAAHHHLRVAFDKDDVYSRALDVDVPSWLSGHEAPDLWVNGHAHLLQFGTYDVGAVATGTVSGARVPTLVSGAGSKVRPAPSCGLAGASVSDQKACANPDPRGMPDVSISRFGYAVVDLFEGHLEVRLVDFEGDTLFRKTLER
jgi:hypothetical protein